jgi:glycosyltransferase involved in cell wall biosynthesis
VTIRVAFPLIGGESWTGGYVYLKNTLSLIRSRLADTVEASVVLSLRERDRYGAELSPLVDGRLIVDPSTTQAGSGLRAVEAVVAGRDRLLARLLQQSGVDVAFEVARFYGARFPIPLISWMADFQHRVMPEMFSPLRRWRRDAGFRLQLRAGRTIMLSSETARADLKRFYPRAAADAHVVPFALDLDLASPRRRGEDVRAKYALPDRFFFLPNQFWRHKNHDVVVGALQRLKTSAGLDRIPPIILSGLTKGQHGTAHFDAICAQVRAAGAESHFRYLGLIPYNDVLALNAACDALINPSRFEGWSTPIEEAKALGTPLVLADIPIHREQAPQARFFDAASGEQLAQAMIDLADLPPTKRPPLSELVTAQNVRVEAHAARLLATIRAAVSAGRR